MMICSLCCVCVCVCADLDLMTMMMMMIMITVYMNGYYDYISCHVYNDDEPIIHNHCNNNKKWKKILFKQKWTIWLCVLCMFIYVIFCCCCFFRWNTDKIIILSLLRLSLMRCWSKMFDPFIHTNPNIAHKHTHTQTSIYSRVKNGGFVIICNFKKISLTYFNLQPVWFFLGGGILFNFWLIQRYIII